MKKHILALVAAIALPMSMFAQTGSGNKIGGMDRAEFDRINAEGAAKVAAVKPSSTPLSEGDKALMMKMAKGGMMQLQVSQAALPKLTREDVQALAKSEVEEQTGLSQKLMEIASAKGVTLPGEPAAGTDGIIKQMDGKSGADLDMYYTRTSGIDGHKKLESTMSTVSKTAKDPALKEVANAALPLIRTHMRVSQGVAGAGAGKKMTKAVAR